MSLTVKILLALITVTMAGCASKEYRIEKKICDSSAREKFPPKIISKIGTCYRTIEIPYRTDCDTYADGFGGFSTRCTQRTKKERIPYSCTTEIDTNRTARSEFVTSCVRTSCLERYGNKDCDADKPRKEREYKSSVSSFAPISYETFIQLQMDLDGLSFWDFEAKEPLLEKLDIYCKQQGRKKYNDLAGRCFSN